MVNKVSKSRYKSYGQKINLSRRGSELTRQIDEIRRQRDIKISGLRALADNEQRNDELYIRGLKAKGATELENKQQIHKFEREATSNRMGAIEVAAEGEIRALLGQAEEAEKQKNFWQDFAVNHSQKYAKLAAGALKLVDDKQSIRMLAKLDPKFAYKAAENFTKATKIVEKNALKEVGADKKRKNPILDPITKKEIIKGSGTSNIHYQNKMVEEVKKGRAFYASVMQRYAKDEFGKSLLTTSMAQDAYISYSYHLLKELNIDPASKAGREITRTFGVWGRDVAEARWNQHQATKDLGTIQEKAETLATEIRLALAETEPTKKQEELWDNAQITFQGLTHIINGSIYESSDGKFGLRSWNPQTLNAEVIKQVYPFLREMSFDQLYPILNKLKIFDEGTAKVVLERGKEVGILDKSRENQKILLDLVLANDKFKQDQTQAKINSDRQTLIAPYDQAYEEAVESGDFTKFNEMIPSYIALVNTDKFANTTYRQQAWDRTRFNPVDYGDYVTYKKAEAELQDGNLDEAVIILASTAGTGEIKKGYAHPDQKHFKRISKAVRRINNLTKDVGTINEAALSIYKQSFKKTAFSDSLITEKDKRVITALKHHLIREIVNNESDDAAYKVMLDARETVSKAFLNGIENQQGLYAATEASISNWTPAVKDKNGVVIKRGGYGKEGKTSSRPASLNNYVFHNYDDKIDLSVTQSPVTLAREFIWTEGNEGIGATLTKEHLEARIEVNLNGPNSILTVDEKNFFAQNIFNGNADPNAINTNLKLLITMAKKHNKDITTRDVMNMVAKGLAANTEADYSQLEGKSYPMGLEDITKKITGKCTGNLKNDYALCIDHLLKEAGVDLNKDKITAGNLLDLYK